MQDATQDSIQNHGQDMQTSPILQPQMASEPASEPAEQAAEDSAEQVAEQSVAEVVSEVISGTMPETTAGALSAPRPSSVHDDLIKKTRYFNNSIFWVELEKIVPNPYQPRREFDPVALRDLSDSIRMYGLLQPLVVTRREIIKEDGGLVVQYELISGERRLRASKLANLSQVPVIIRANEEDARTKLELAIIENLQREDLNPIDRARSFQRLSDEFGLTHLQIAEKVGKSREYVSNSIRLLALPEHMLAALSEKKITEGHTRPLLMLIDRPAEQEVLFKEITSRKMTVREAEQAARRVAVDRIRKQDTTPEIRDLERKFNAALGTRVMIERKEQGGKLVIDFFNIDDIRALLDKLSNENQMAHSTAPVADSIKAVNDATPIEILGSNGAADSLGDNAQNGAAAENTSFADQAPIDDSTPADVQEDESLYSVKGFTI